MTSNEQHLMDRIKDHKTKCKQASEDGDIESFNYHDFELTNLEAQLKWVRENESEVS